MAFLCYFGFHTFNGAYGLIAYQAINNDIKKLENRLAEVVAEREALELRAALLAHGSPDREVVDELARAKLNVIHPNEVVYLAH